MNGRKRTLDAAAALVVEAAGTQTDRLTNMRGRRRRGSALTPRERCMHLHCASLPSPVSPLSGGKRGISRKERVKNDQPGAHSFAGPCISRMHYVE